MPQYTIDVPTHGFVYENLAEQGSGQTQMSQVGDRSFEHRIDDSTLLALSLLLGSKRRLTGWRDHPHVELQSGEVIICTEAILHRWVAERGNPQGGYWDQGRTVSLSQVALT